jgi:hypothetical protein
MAGNIFINYRRGVFAAFLLCLCALAAPLQAREELTGNRTYYVATTGSDANDGLSVGSPFLTVQKCWDTIVETLDLKGHGAKCQLADGTYAQECLHLTGQPPGYRSGLSITIEGNDADPDAVVLQGCSDGPRHHRWR